MNDYKSPPRPAPGRMADRGPRRWTTESFVPFRLEILTPVFIGTGTDLSPLEYVIRKEADTHVLHLVDSQSWLLASQDKADIRSALDRGDMAALRRLMDEHLDAALYSTARIRICSATLGERLKEEIRDPKSESNAEIQPFPRSPVSMATYVPGSSLKGALSTPLIDSLDHDGSLRNAGNAYASVMRGMFGPITHHAMQALKISDVPAPPGSSGLVAATEVPKVLGTDLTKKNPCEAILPTASERLPFYGRMLADCARGRPTITLPAGRPPISLADLVKVCNRFYVSRFYNEMDTFYRLRHLAYVSNELKPVLARIDSLDPKREILLRVGHYSHVECVTVTANAPQCPKGFGNTRTLANGQIPFGWLILSFCSIDEYETGSARVEQSIMDAARERESIRLLREANITNIIGEQVKMAMAVEQARVRAAEEQRKKEREAAEREARLAALSPEERQIAELAGPEATKEQSMQLYSLLKDMAGEDRLRAARALRDCWQRLGEWGGKQLSKKQALKVAEVKAILES